MAEYLRQIRHDLDRVVIVPGGDLILRAGDEVPADVMVSNHLLEPAPAALVRAKELIKELSALIDGYLWTEPDNAR